MVNLSSSFYSQTVQTLAEYGSDTTFNGQTVKAIWNQAELSRVHQFLSEEEWIFPSYELVLSADIIGGVDGIHSGTEIVYTALGWGGVVRHVDIAKIENGQAFVHCIVVMLPKRTASTSLHRFDPPTVNLSNNATTALLADTLSQFGSETSINGATTWGLWSEGEMTRVQQYLSPNEWYLPCYEVTLTSDTLYDPYLIVEASQITDLVNNQIAAVRNIDVPLVANQAQFVHLVTVILPREGGGL